MAVLEALSGWTKEQKSVVAAAFLGWMLDAFDFFLLVFVIRDIAAEFNTDIPSVAFALVLTLALRPIGAFIFGRAADRYGRRPTLIANVLCYSLLAFASGFATDLTMLLVLRGLFGIAMGGEWGVGASITMETIPPKARGIVSGFLQAGYPTGYLLASIVYFFLYPYVGWRGMFMLGILPALLTGFILVHVKESPTWKPREEGAGDLAESLLPYARLVVYALVLWAATAIHAELPVIADIAIGATLLASLYSAWRSPTLWIEFAAVIAILIVNYLAALGFIHPEMAIIYNAAAVLAGVFLREHWRMGLYAMVLMTAFNFFSHGTQDLYPTFLQVQQGFSPATVGTIAVIYNIGAILGSLVFGNMSEQIGRRRAIVIAALLSLPLLPLWAYAGSPLWFAVGSFLMQFMVQAAWGVIPVHLNELSPPDVRGTFPGFTYQLGNLLASVNATLQADYAARHGNDYAMALVLVAGASAIAIALLVGFGVERKGVHLETGSATPPDARAPARMTPQEQQ
jgi:putative sialic acid transporter